MVEYWRPGSYEKPDNVFEYKSSTNLFEFKKAKSTPASLTISPSGSQFATFSFPDRKIRVFDFPTGKLYRTYDESLQTIEDMQQAGTALQKLEDLEFGRRLGVERELDNPAFRNKVNVIFDETGHFIIYGSMLGTKVLNTYTNRVVRVYGKDENFRPLSVAMYQGQPQKKGVTTVAMAASNNPLLQESEGCGGKGGRVWYGSHHPHNLWRYPCPPLPRCSPQSRREFRCAFQTRILQQHDFPQSYPKVHDSMRRSSGRWDWRGEYLGEGVRG
jgi:hypothetical protein